MLRERVTGGMDVKATAEAIAHVQRDDGAIPEYAGAEVGPWNHIEAAMALDVCGLHDEAARAYSWLVRRQRPDGGWGMTYMNGEETDPTFDANFVAYIAAGVWHHYLATGDAGSLHAMWPTMSRAIDAVLAMQRPDGTIAWARDGKGKVARESLLTSCSCIALSLRCAIAVARQLGADQPDWELALVSLDEAIRRGPEAFAPKERFSMDWYYPVLSGALDVGRARAVLLSRWDSFVIEDRGCRCVSDKPWVTAGETAELVLACAAAGLRGPAEDLLGWIGHLRDDDGAYWIGATHPDGTVWPRIKPTWGSGSIVLAADALYGEEPTSRFFCVASGSLKDPEAPLGERLGEPSL